jgi:hypothetical protein
MTGPTQGRGMFSVGAAAPPEIRLACWLLVTGGLVFVLVDVVRAATEDGDQQAFLVPLLQLLVAVGIAGGLLRGLRLARLLGLLFVLTVALLHTLIAMQPYPLWVRILTGLIAASQVYVAVLLNTKPALQYTGGAPRRR